MQQIKYGDLSNQASKDYIFDVERFTSFEGNTGPYILYTIVRIKSILEKYMQEGKNPNEGTILEAVNDSEKNLMLELSKFNSVHCTGHLKRKHHIRFVLIFMIWQMHLTAFYHETKILSESNEEQKKSGFVC